MKIKHFIFVVLIIFFQILLIWIIGTKEFTYERDTILTHDAKIKDAEKYGFTSSQYYDFNNRRPIILCKTETVSVKRSYIPFKEEQKIIRKVYKLNQ